MAYTFLKIKDSMAIGTSLYDEEGMAGARAEGFGLQELEWGMES